MEQQYVDLDVNAAYDPSFCDTAYWGCIAYDADGQVCNQAADEVYADGEDSLDATIATYEALVAALTWASDEAGYRIGILRSANAEVVSALLHDRPPERAQLGALWQTARELLAARGGVVRLGTPSQLTRADTLAQDKFQQGIISQAQERRGLVRRVEAWVEEWESVQIDLEEMWDTIEAHGVHRERTWLP